MKKKILGFVMIGIAAMMFAIEVPKGNTEPIAPSIMFIIIGIFLITKKWKTKEQKIQDKKEKQLAEERMQKILYGTHFVGLPLGEGVNAAIAFEDDSMSIKCSGGNFSLLYSKVLSMEVKTDVEIQKTYVSSVGGAVGGAVLFGPIGAMIGGRAKEKKTKVVEYYLIITYEKDDNIEYMSFKILNTDCSKAKTNIQRISSSFASPREIAL